VTHRLLSSLLLAILALTLTPVLAAGTLRLATTTSMAASGLLDQLVPAFEQASGYQVRHVAVGSGLALRMARAGDVDAVLTHSPAAEQRLVADGHALARHPVMYNRFVIIGPATDPAGIAGLTDVSEALTRIARHRAVFLSRGDDSGTHRKELQLWQAAGIDPLGQPWYRELGSGIAGILRAASDHQAYTLADRGSWLRLRRQLALQVLVTGDARLHNPYAVLTVARERHPAVNSAAATAWVEWLLSPAAQGLIRDFQVDGEPLFLPGQPATPGS
jgi:tungstate transport system substrate-binding protein